jgi:trehalose synthase-fused probable maltokinase
MAAPGFRKEIVSELKASLPVQLPAYLKMQRWFGAKAREFAAIEILDVIPLEHDGLPALVVFVRVQYQGGGSDLYSIPLVGAEDLPGRIEGEQQLQLSVKSKDRDGKMIFSDALKDEKFLTLLLDAFHRGLVFRGETGEMRATRTRAFSLLETGASGSLHPKAMTAEQSNSSIAYGNRLMLKFFRRLEEGENPDLEVGRFLTGKANYQQTPQVLGALEYSAGNGTQMTQGILQAFVPNQGDAWSYALKSISGFYAVVAKLPQPPPDDAQQLSEAARGNLTEFLDSAGLLARRTAEMHLALSCDANNPAFAPEQFDENFQHRFIDALLQLTARVFGQLKDNLSMATSSNGQKILTREEKINQYFRSALSQPLQALRTRIHGDYHLGQVLYTGHDFVIIDFEGEPARPLAERRLKRSPLQDVAGMLRSFHYAAHAPLQLADGIKDVAESSAQNLEPWAEAWAKWVSARFMKDYLEYAQGASFLPPKPEERMSLLRVHILEKAIYELGYEMNNRPTWVAIPMRGILKALES